MSEQSLFIRNARPDNPSPASPSRPAATVAILVLAAAALSASACATRERVIIRVPDQLTQYTTGCAEARETLAAKIGVSRLLLEGAVRAGSPGYEEARALILDLAESEPQNPDVVMLQAWLAAYDGEAEAAEMYARAAVEACPQNPVAYQLLGESLFLQAQDIAAIDAYKAAAEYSLDPVPMLWALSGWLETLDRISAAERTYRRILEEAPGDPDAVAALADILVAWENPNAAIALLRDAIAAAPGDAFLLRRLAALHRSLGTEDQLEAAAEVLARATEANPYDREAWILLADLQRQLHRYEAAEETLRTAAEQFEDDHRPYAELARLHNERGDLESAEAALREAIARNERDFQLIRQLAHLLEASGNAELAMRSYLQAVELVPESPHAQLDLGLAFMRQERYDEAKVAFAAAVDKNPTLASAHDLLAQTSLETGDFETAIAAARRAVALDSEHPFYPDTLGQALAADGRLEEAVEAFRLALQRDAQQPETLHRLGNALAELGRAEEAELAHCGAAAIAPGDERFGAACGSDAADEAR